MDLTDADLEAELMALEGKSPGKGGKSPKSGGSGMMSMDELDNIVAGLDGMGEEEGEDEDMSDIDEDELLGELKVITN